MDKRPDYIVVGRFGRPHGVKGEISVTPMTDFPERFLNLREVFMISGNRKVKIVLDTVVMQGDRPLVKVAGIDNREEAARLVNTLLAVPAAEAVELPEGSHYHFDLIDCRVEGIDGTDYGLVSEVLFNPANDLLRVRSRRFGDVLLPVVDRFVKSIDIEKKKIIIDPPPGLFEEAGN